MIIIMMMIEVEVEVFQLHMYIICAYVCICSSLLMCVVYVLCTLNWLAAFFSTLLFIIVITTFYPIEG